MTLGMERAADESAPLADVAARAIRRVRRRLIPFLALLYFVAYLDRVNVGFAALQMNAALGLSPLQYGRGAGIFFLGYFLFEVPSNIALARVGARFWIARIAIVWGLVSMAMIFAAGPNSFNLLRFLLGAAEAGFFPGIVFYFTHWFPAREQARALAQFSTASMAAGIVGAPLSGALLSLRGAAGFDGWQWLFLIEGLPAVILGIVAIAYLDDEPAKAAWLPDDEKRWLVETMERERSAARLERGAGEGVSTEPPALFTIRAGLLDPGVWRLALVLFLVVTSGYGFSFFLPQIVKRLSGGSDLAVGLWTAVPFTFAAIGMITIAAHSDRTAERRLHVAACASLAGTGLMSASFFDAPAAALALLAAAAVGLYSATPPFWSLPTAYLRGEAAAAGIGFINSVGNLGGFVGPYLMGWMQGATGDFRFGLRTLAASAICSALLVLTVKPRQR
jgi:MFS transporter, ACS family, tartrate transporter